MKNQRVRRSREDARAEILKAAEAVLDATNLPVLTVDEIMRRTGMTRSAFYHYFSGLEDLSLALLERFEREVRESVDPWLTGELDEEEPRTATVTHLGAMFEVLHRHRAAFSAVLQAAGEHPRVYQEWQTRVLGYFIDITEGFIRRQVEAGCSRAEDPRNLARALILMNNAVMNDSVQRDPDTDARTQARVVAGIWNAAIFGSAAS